MTDALGDTEDDDDDGQSDDKALLTFAHHLRNISSNSPNIKMKVLTRVCASETFHQTRCMQPALFSLILMISLHDTTIPQGVISSI